MKNQALCLLVVLLASACQALWFNSDRLASSEGREVEQSCLTLAEEGSCEFYACFERRLPCGRNWYIVRHGQYYCNKMEREQPNFSEDGQTFLTDVKRCMAMSLVDVYQETNLSCHSLEHQAVESMTQCFVDNSFCDVFDDNVQQFFQVYEFGDLFTRGAGKIWRVIVNLATECGGEAIREITASAGESISGAFRGLFSGVNNIFDRKRK